MVVEHLTAWMPDVLRLAQLSRAHELFDQSKRIHSPVWTIIGYLIVISVLVIIAALLVRRIFRTVTQPKEHMKLFVQLVNVHGLSDLEARALRRLARQANLDNPARLFIDRTHLQNELGIPMHRDPILPGLYNKLFGG